MNTQTRDSAWFREWCNKMELDSYQAADVIGIGLSNIYQCLGEDEGVPIRTMVVINCELINDLPEESRREWISSKLDEAENKRAWPSPNPITL
jgi:hypothetical protein